MEDLDVARLANYLHLSPDQVTKMAVRGRIPGRKVGGQWRFSEAEIHHWLEESSRHSPRRLIPSPIISGL